MNKSEIILPIKLVYKTRILLFEFLYMELMFTLLYLRVREGFNDPLYQHFFISMHVLWLFYFIVQKKSYILITDKSFTAKIFKKTVISFEEMDAYRLSRGFKDKPDSLKIHYNGVKKKKKKTLRNLKGFTFESNNPNNFTKKDDYLDIIESIFHKNGVYTTEALPNLKY